MKTSVHDLAQFGGMPLFSAPIHVGRPNIVGHDAILKRLQSVFHSGWLTNDGPELRQFELQIATYLGVAECVATCNATTAIQLALRALDLTGEVIIPSFTFPATAHALAWQGITPVFADICPDDWTLDVAHVESLISPRTSAIMGVHLFGTSCRIDALQRLARRYRLRLLFDACHAFGCHYQGRRIGGEGDLEIFSFHATKFVNSAEGGAITTNQPEIAARLRRLRNFGFNAEGETDEPGINGKMSEVSAVIGSVSLDHIDSILDHNRQNLLLYQQELRGIPGISLRIPERIDNHNCQYVVAEIDASRFGLSRDTIAELLKSENILVRRYFHPGCHRLAPYTLSGTATLPHTDAAISRVLVLPTGLSIGLPAIARIAGLLAFLQENATAIDQYMQSTHPDCDRDRLSTFVNHLRVETIPTQLPESHLLSIPSVHPPIDTSLTQADLR